MKKEHETAIDCLIKRAGEEGNGNAACLFAQAALNVANTVAMCDDAIGIEFYPVDGDDTSDNVEGMSEAAANPQPDHTSQPIA